MAAGLAGFAQAGLIHPYPIELMAPALLALLAEASRAVAANPAQRGSALDMMKRMLDSLRTDR